MRAASAPAGPSAADLDERIDDGGELFGGRFEGGLAELAASDLNGDGLIDAADAVFADLQVWRDLDQDGASDAQHEIRARRGRLK